MSSKADRRPETAFPTVEELISQLRSTFFSVEFQNVAKKLIEREQHIEDKHLKFKLKIEEEKRLLISENQKLNDELKKKQDSYLKLKSKVEEEKSLLLSENQKLKDELKKKQDNYLKLKTEIEEKNQKLNDELKKKEDEIDAMRKLNAEYENKIRVNTKRSLDFADNVPMGSGRFVNLENKEQKDRANESNRPPLFSKKEDSKKKTEPKMQGIIQISDDDDDEDDDHKCISTLKRKQVPNEIKRECNTDDDDVDLEFITTSKRKRVLNKIKKEYNTNDDDLDVNPASKKGLVSDKMKREHHGGPAKITPLFKKSESDSSASDSGSDTEISKLYMFSSSKVKKPKERWESESDMVKDLEKDDELCLNGICALHRQKTIYHGSDLSSVPNLARKLIDGDSQRKLKKKASELNQSDLENCRMFAKKYSLQLFNIYQNKSDPFFPTSRSQEKRSAD